MKCSEIYRILIRDGWYAVSQKGSHIKLRHNDKPGMIVFPDHGSQELGKGLERRILKSAGIKTDS
jgi:predicted RNA binding protein YcfA (HicA-like mRNA interferase family)